MTADADRLRRLLDWSLPPGMPDAFAFLIRLVRMMFRARWEILQPRYEEARYHAPSPERCAEIARSVIEEYGRMQRDAEAEEMTGLDKFYAAFRRRPAGGRGSIRRRMDAAHAELADGAGANAEELCRQLKDLLSNNTKWLNVAARQFGISVADLG